MRRLARFCTQNNCPLLIAGDLFDRWNPPPELINFAMEVLGEFPNVFAIPGQHDLAHHQLVDIKKTAYWTMCAAGVITNLDFGSANLYAIHDDYPLWGFPWGTDPKGLYDKGIPIFKNCVALVHDYCWMEDHCHGGTLDNRKQVGGQKKRFKGFKLGIFGDNHKGFLHQSSDPDYKGVNIVNCGTFYRRRIDEVDYKPRAWVIDEFLDVEAMPINCERDVFYVPEAEDAKLISAFGLEDLIQDLSRIGQEKEIDFALLVKDVLKSKPYSKRVKDLVLKALG
jgi:hypothetical protein